jgi:CheY-like chemotaxis protein
MRCDVKTILVLEDEPLVMKLLRQVLKTYNVIAAGTAEQALAILANHECPVDLLVTDVRLPTLSGIQVALRIRSDRPDFPILLVSGYPAEGWRDVDAADLQELGSNCVVVLQKPFHAKVLLKAACELLGASSIDLAKTA